MKRVVIDEFDRDGANLYLDNLFFDHLIIDAYSILLLKKGEKIVIGKKNDYNGKDLYFCEKIEYDKQYLSVGFPAFGFGSKNYLLTRGDEQAILLEQKLKPYGKNRKFNELEMSREELEEYFNHKNYDSMYWLNFNKGLLFASNKKDGTIIDTKIVPSDDEIIDLEWRLRIDSTITYNINSPRAYTPFIDFHCIQKRDIESIKGVSIYAPVSFYKYEDILITSNDGKISAKWFKMDFIEKDKFRLKTMDEPLLDESIDLDSPVVSKTNKQKSLLKSIFKTQ